jgi:hypothetical protein
MIGLGALYLAKPNLLRRSGWEGYLERTLSPESYTKVFRGLGIFLIVVGCILLCIAVGHRIWEHHHRSESSVSSNQAMQRTAGRAAFPLPMNSTFNPQPRSPSPAVADLVSR